MIYLNKEAVDKYNSLGRYKNIKLKRKLNNIDLDKLPIHLYNNNNDYYKRINLDLSKEFREAARKRNMRYVDFINYIIINEIE